MGLRGGVFGGDEQWKQRQTKREEVEDEEERKPKILWESSKPNQISAQNKQVKSHTHF